MIVGKSAQHRRRAGLLWLVWLQACLWMCSAAAAPADAPQFHHTAWSAQDGAPADIWALAQGHDGYLWLGTGTGLYRFDGLQFERFDPPSGQAFASNNITALYMAPDDTLWIGFLFGGISALRDGQLTHYRVEDGAPAGMVMGFAQDGDGHLWAASFGGLARLDGQRWRVVGQDWNCPAGRAYAVLADSRRTLWAIAGDTLVYLPAGEHAFRPTREPIGGYSSLAEAPDGAIWVSDGLHGTRRLPDARNPGRVPHPPAATDFAHFASMRVDSHGVLWGTDRTGGGVIRTSALQRIPGGRSLREDDVDAIVRKRDGLSSDKTVPVLEDREGNIWVGTNLGLHRFRYNDIRAFQDERLSQQFGYAIADAGAQGLLVSSGGRVYRLMHGALEQLADTGARTIGTMVMAADASVWLGAENGLWRLRGRELVRVQGPDGIDAASDSIIVSDGGSGLVVQWVHGGLYRFDGSTWQVIDRGNRLQAEVTVLARTAGGVLWTGHADGTLTRWDDRQKRVYARREGLNVGAVSAIAAVGEGLLVAGEVGVAYLRHGRAHTLSAAPAEQLHGVTGIIVLAQGDIWLNGVRGVVRLRGEELRSAADEPGRLLETRLFNFDDGLPGVALQTAYSPTALANRAGRLWFSTNQGLASVDPRRLHTNRTIPPVAIRSLVTNGKRYLALDGTRLPKGTQGLRIDYTALSLSNPRRVRLRYRLSGVDAQWQDAGNRRQAFYTNLGPGEYSFQVIAANDSGVWNLQGDTLHFAIKPRFVETWWFASLCIIAVAGLLFGLYLLRLRQVAERLRGRLEERHRERERIARELHDTLLQSVQGLVLRFQAVANKIPSKDPARMAMEHALDRADEVIGEARDRVYELRAAAVAMPPGLPEAFAQVGEELAEQHAIEFRVLVEGRLPGLDPLVRDEIYRIGREALINASRHARASRIEVEISSECEWLRFRFRDDGQGMDQDVQQKGSKAGHWGLSGMRERAHAIGAQLNTWSRAGSGTEVELILPLPCDGRGGAKRGWRARLAAFISRDRHV